MSFGIYLTVFLFHSLKLEIINAKSINNTEDGQKICGKTYFEQNYVNQERYASLQSMNEICGKRFSNICSGGAGTVTVSMNESNSNLYLIVRGNREDFIKGGKAEGCWGVALERRSDRDNDDTVTDYSNFKNNESSQLEWTMQLNMEITYTFVIAVLPSFSKKVEFILKSPNRCQLDGMQEILKEEIEHGRKKNCKTTISLLDKLKLTEDICKMYPTKAKKIFAQKVFIANCVLKTLITPQVEAKWVPHSEINSTSDMSNNLKIVLAAVSPTITLLVIAVFVTIYIKRRNIRSGAAILAHETQATLAEPQVGAPPTVMILNRPGCDLLESFLRDLAFILQSYNINIKMALLERNQLDAEGGIASYMQKNIAECDWILILCTEKLKAENVIWKHKPFEFASKVIGGMAFHQNDCSRYIPLYLTSYEEAVEMIPPFLNASTTFGFCVPLEIEKLVQILLQTSTLELSEERKAKNKFFMGRMMDNSGKILENQHVNCAKENCLKGLDYGSITNLSAAWPSTAPSHYSVTQFTDESLCELALIPYDTILISKYNTMLNGQALTQQEVVDKECQLILLNKPDDGNNSQTTQNEIHSIGDSTYLNDNKESSNIETDKLLIPEQYVCT